MNRLAVVRTYSGALAGIHVFLILDFSGSIKHLDTYLENIDNLLSGGFKCHLLCVVIPGRIPSDT